MSNSKECESIGETDLVIQEKWSNVDLAEQLDVSKREAVQGDSDRLEGDNYPGNDQQGPKSRRRGAKKSKKEKDAKEQRQQAFNKSLYAALDEWSDLQKQSKMLLPVDMILKMKEALKQDALLRVEKTGQAAAAGEFRKGSWDYARTTNMVNRAVLNGVQGISLRQDGGLVVEDDVKIVGIVKDPPHTENAAKHIRSQAVDFDRTRPVNGPFKEEKISKPVDRPCKIGWFMLPTNVKLDFGKAEEYPGMHLLLGDWKKCGLAPEAQQAFRDRPLFMKIFERVAADMERVGMFLSILVQDLHAELDKDECDLRARMKPIVDDLDDVCSIQCNRSAALFYLLCQHVRAHVLDATPLKGFFKNWMRVAHASKVLFEPGITDAVNCQVRAGEKDYPELNSRARKKRETQAKSGFGLQNCPNSFSESAFVGQCCAGGLLENRKYQQLVCGAFGGQSNGGTMFPGFFGPAF